MVVINFHIQPYGEDGSPILSETFRREITLVHLLIRSEPVLRGLARC